MKGSATYKVKDEFKGCTVYTCPVPYERPDGSVFDLSKDLPQKDLAFLCEVIGHEGIEKE